MRPVDKSIQHSHVSGKVASHKLHLVKVFASHQGKAPLQLADIEILLEYYPVVLLKVSLDLLSYS